MQLKKYKEKRSSNKIIGLFLILTTLLLAGIYLYTSFAYYSEEKKFDVINGSVSDPGDIYFAFYVDDKISKSMPKEEEGYLLDSGKSTFTNGATPELNLETWSILVKNMTVSKTKCTLYFKK